MDPIETPPTPAIQLNATVTPASKPVWQSKTLIASALVALLPLIPGVGPVAMAWVVANPEAFSAILGAAFAGLRIVTNGSVSIK